MEVHDRVFVRNDPVNRVDPLGLMDGATLGRLGTGLMITPIPGARPVGVAVLGGAAVFAGWEAYTHFAKGGKQNVRDTGLSHLPDEVIDQRANDRSLSPGERRRYQKEQKARKKRNKRKRCQ